jgi:hypothetical protein
VRGGACTRGGDYTTINTVYASGSVLKIEVGSLRGGI